MKNGILYAVAVAAAMAGGSGAMAHHSTAAYDIKASVTLRGTVRAFRWANPHNYVQLLVTDKRGVATEWSIEVGTPGTATRQGWTRTSFKPGDNVTVVVAPMKSGAPEGTLKTAQLADGRTLRSVAADADAAAPFTLIPTLKRVDPKAPQ